MVWVNQFTGEKAFHVHSICVRKLYLRSSLDEKPRVVDNVDEIHQFIPRLPASNPQTGNTSCSPQQRKETWLSGTIITSSTLPLTIPRNGVGGRCTRPIPGEALAPKDLCRLTVDCSSIVC